MKKIFFPLLYLLSWVVRLVTAIDQTLRSLMSVRLPGLVLSVGNITLGGTGKTPWVIKIAKDCQSLGFQPAILTRGYKGLFQGSGDNRILRGSTVPRPDSDLSDESRLMLEKCPNVPIGVGPNRIELARNIEKTQNPDVFILDDGFQHWPIKRDIDLVCIDATDPWGGDCLVPAGRLREPLKSLKRAHVVVLTRADLVAPPELKKIETRLMAVAPQLTVLKGQFATQLWSVSDHESRNPTELYGRSVCALSALGHPEGFEETLKKYGAFVSPFRFPDHHRYSDDDYRAIERKLTQSTDLLVTTEKDWTKLKTSDWVTTTKYLSRVYVLIIEAQLDQDESVKWLSFLRSKYNETKISH